MSLLFFVLKYTYTLLLRFFLYCLKKHFSQIKVKKANKFKYKTQFNCLNRKKLDSIYIKLY